MTFYIRRIDGRGTLSLHNGLWGPATDALHALIDAFRTGTLTGPWHSSYIDATVKGVIVRSILAGIDELDPDYQLHGDHTDWARFVHSGRR